jgi:hypothetical protein
VRAAGQLNSARILGTVFNAQNDLLPRYENYGQRQLGRSHEE